MKVTRIGIAGASGRMGRKLIEAIHHTQSKLLQEGEFEQITLAAALEHLGHPMLGTDANLLVGQVGTSNKTVTKKPILLSDTFDPKSVNVFIDFSTPAAAVELSKKCRQNKTPLVVGVTAFSKAEKKELLAASADIPLLMSPNMSLGMRFMFDIVRQATSLFKNYGDIEICETHHRHKKDAPSGTALRLGEIIAKEIGVPFDDVAVFNRERQGNTRGDNEIGFSSIRGGDIVGEHRVTFASHGEQIEIIHRSTDRITYAVGAILAAMHIADKPPGLYDMEDVFEKHS